MTKKKIQEKAEIKAAVAKELHQLHEMILLENHQHK